MVVVVVVAAVVVVAVAVLVGGDMRFLTMLLSYIATIGISVFFVSVLPCPFACCRYCMVPRFVLHDFAWCCITYVLHQILPSWNMFVLPHTVVCGTTFEHVYDIRFRYRISGARKCCCKLSHMFALLCGII